jgi:hypothetical protein
VDSKSETELCVTLSTLDSFESEGFKHVPGSCDPGLAFDLALQLSCLLPPKRRVRESASTAP